jgi:hypothetical protein
MKILLIKQSSIHYIIMFKYPHWNTKKYTDETVKFIIFEDIWLHYQIKMILDKFYIKCSTIRHYVMFYT